MYDLLGPYPKEKQGMGIVEIPESCMNIVESNFIVEYKGIQE